MFLVLLEHPRLCHTWCRCVLRPAEVWSYTDPLSLCIMGIVPKAGKSCLLKVFVQYFGKTGPRWHWMISSFCIFICALCKDLTLPVFRLPWVTAALGSWWGSLLVTPVSSFSTFGQLTSITVGSLQSIWHASWALNFIQNPLGKTVGRWLIFLFVF